MQFFVIKFLISLSNYIQKGILNIIVPLMASENTEVNLSEFLEIPPLFACLYSWFDRFVLKLILQLCSTEPQYIIEAVCDLGII